MKRIDEGTRREEGPSHSSELITPLILCLSRSPTSGPLRREVLRLLCSLWLPSLGFVFLFPPIGSETKTFLVDAYFFIPSLIAFSPFLVLLLVDLLLPADGGEQLSLFSG